jgi:hypothetical protein
MLNVLHMCHGRIWKAALMLVAMCAVLTVGTAAASAHQHSEIIGGDCDLCCVGHLPALQSPHLSDIRPSAFLDWQIPAEEYFSSLDPQFSATFGRAPPV